ncbi:MAG: YIP1 family protein [Desulfobacterales bacterium]|nr:YIP1 family protein [Desulfobacterales bacterium]
MSLYRVIFLGLAVAGPEEEVRLIKGLQRKFNLSPEKAESLLQRVPIVIKKGVSKEEMERYVKAFEEIGGRIRIEEEPAAEALEISQRATLRSEPKKEPYSGTRITCPQCGFEQPETDTCIQCGITISKYFQYQGMARSYEGKIREISSEEKYAPFESGEGFIGAFLKTIREALFSPTRFFKKVATGEGYWTPLIYGIITGIIGRFADFFWAWLVVIPFLPPSIRNFLAISYTFVLMIIIFSMPLWVAFSILLWSGVTHFCLIIVRGSKKGFEGTFRAISYSYSARLFHIVPFIGSTIGFVYRIALAIIGVREAHGITTGRALIAILLPLIVVVGIVIAILLPLFIRTMGFFGGMRV